MKQPQTQFCVSSVFAILPRCTLHVSNVPFYFSYLLEILREFFFSVSQMAVCLFFCLLSNESSSHYYRGRSDILKDKNKMVLCGVSSMTSPRREPCVCHTHTEKQALHNRSVKSPCSKTGAGWGGGGAAGRDLGALRWHQAEQTTPEFIRKSVFHLGSEAEIKHQVALMADSHTLTHTRRRGNINYTRRHVWWETIAAHLEEQFFKVNAGFMRSSHSNIVISSLRNNSGQKVFFILFIVLFLKTNMMSWGSHKGRLVLLLLQLVTLCNHCSQQFQNL